jgi:type IV secretion system protein VirB11
MTYFNRVLMPNGERTLRTLLRSFEPFSDDPMVTEIVVNRPGEIGIERAGAWSWHERPELDFDTLDAIAILSAYGANKDVDPTRPLCSCVLPNDLRLFIARPPATLHGRISLTMRKPASVDRSVHDDDFEALFAEANARKIHKAQIDEELVRLRRAGEWRKLVLLARKNRKTIGITGATGSGKTDMAKRLMRITDPDLRLITIESDPETAKAGTRNTVNLLFGDSRSGITPVQCVDAALRMRPDEIHLGEIRGAEGFAYLRALAAGHPGGITTWHAMAGEEITALIALIKEHESGRALDDVEQRIKTFIDVIFWCDRSPVTKKFSVPHVWLKAEEGIAA